jgi:putative membrane protein
MSKKPMNEQGQKLSLQEELALTRTVLALDRTLLAWIRTSVSLIAFGFTLARFVHDLIMSGSLRGVDAQYPRHLGVILMVLGVCGLLGGAFDHWRAVKKLKPDVAIAAWSASLLVSLILVVVSVLLMFNLLTNLDQTLLPASTDPQTHASTRTPQQ